MFCFVHYKSDYFAKKSKAVLNSLIHKYKISKWKNKTRKNYFKTKYTLLLECRLQYLLGVDFKYWLEYWLVLTGIYWLECWMESWMECFHWSVAWSLFYSIAWSVDWNIDSGVLNGMSILFSLLSSHAIFQTLQCMLFQSI